MLILQEFVSNLFWRIPKNDELFLQEFKSNPLFNKSFKFIGKNTGVEVNNDITEKIKNSKEFIQSLRPTVSSFSFMVNKKDDIQNWKLSYTPGYFNICSDNPFIIKDENAKDIFNTEFILPLTKNHLLIRTFSNIEETSLKPLFGFIVNLAIFKQGELYCASANRDLLNTYSSSSKKDDIIKLKNYIFGYLENLSEK